MFFVFIEKPALNFECGRVIYTSGTVDDKVTEKIYVNLYQMRFERSDVTNVASAMDMDDEVSKGLT